MLSIIISKLNWFLPDCEQMLFFSVGLFKCTELRTFLDAFLDQNPERIFFWLTWQSPIFLQSSTPKLLVMICSVASQQPETLQHIFGCCYKCQKWQNKVIPQCFMLAFSLVLTKPHSFCELCLFFIYVYMSNFYPPSKILFPKLDPTDWRWVAVQSNDFKRLISYEIYSLFLACFSFSVHFFYLPQHSTCFTVNSVCPKEQNRIMLNRAISITMRDNIFSLLCLWQCLGQQNSRGP